MINEVLDFCKEIESTSFESELALALTLIKTEYEEDLKDILEGISLALQNDWIIKITIDNDFDGFASARSWYHFLQMFGVTSDRVEFHPLSSLHTSRGRIMVDKCLLLITDTSYGNVDYIATSKNCSIIWIDHHPINSLTYLKAKSRPYCTFINSSLSDHKYIKFLSCGAFMYLLLLSLLDYMNLSSVNHTEMVDRFDTKCRNDSLLSLISDVSPTEHYIGLIKGIYDTDRPEYYQMNKGSKFDYDNKKYFRKYIASINNLIRMERFDIVIKIIEDKVTYDIMIDIERINEDKRVLMDGYFKPLKPTKTSLKNGLEVSYYQVPLAQNPIIRNFKGVVAFIKTPTQRPFIVFSYYYLDNLLYFSCRNNLSIDLANYIKSRVEVETIGGHSNAFGGIINIAYKNDFMSLFDDYSPYNINIKQRIISYDSIIEDFRLLNKVALFNEFSSKDIRIQFERPHFITVVQEPKRTIYKAKTGEGNLPLDVISFELSEIKDTIIAKPELRQTVYDLNKINIAESK